MLEVVTWAKIVNEHVNIMAVNKNNFRIVLIWFVCNFTLQRYILFLE